MVSIISALLILGMGAFSVYTVIKCREVKWVKTCFTVSLALAAVALIGAVCVTLGCVDAVSRLPAENVDNAKSAYFAFMLAAGVFSFIILIISGAAALMRHRLVLVRVLVAYMGALADVAVLSPLFCMLFTLFGVDINIYVELLALCLGILSTLPVSLDLYRLSTPEGLAARDEAPKRKRRYKRR